MSLLLLVVAVAGVTLLSRLTPMVILPAPEGRLATVVARLPAPLFAGLAALSLAPTSAGRPDPAVVAAVLGALLVCRTRSLLLILAAGIAGYLVAAAVLG